jgi:plastocyanin
VARDGRGRDHPERGVVRAAELDPVKLLAITVALFALAPDATRRPPTRMQVSATEYELALSRRAVKQGRAIIELVNLGEDPHDLAIRRNAKGARTYTTKIALPGKETTISFRLYPGRYTLWCTIGNHRAEGMVATLTVLK